MSDGLHAEIYDRGHGVGPRFMLLAVHNIPPGVGSIAFDYQTGELTWTQNSPSAALSAPSEPVQDQPRVWAMPEQPDDVQVVRDRDGGYWYRDPASFWDCRDGDKIIGFQVWEELISVWGPLTEVVEPDGD